MSSRILLLSLIVGLAACGRAEDDSGDHEGEASQITLKGATLHSFKGSELMARARAAKVVYQRGSTAFVAKDAYLEGKSSSGTRMVLRAPTVKGAANAPLFSASGGLVARTEDGTVARTPTARFDGRTQVVTGEEGILITSPRSVISGKVFRLDLLSQEYSFSGGVSTQIGGTR